jgi:prevent-host-death family protein
VAEEFTSITDARRQLPRLSETVQHGGERYVITNQGKPQAVLLGYEEYKGLLAAAELLNRPRDLEHLREGLAQTQRLSFEEMKENVRRRRAAKSGAKGARGAEFAAAAEASATPPIHAQLDTIQADIDEILRVVRGAQVAAAFAAEPASQEPAERGPAREASVRPAPVDLEIMSAMGQFKRDLASAAAGRSPAKRAPVRSSRAAAPRPSTAASLAPARTRS